MLVCLLSAFFFILLLTFTSNICVNCTWCETDLTRLGRSLVLWARTLDITQQSGRATGIATGLLWKFGGIIEGGENLGINMTVRLANK